MTHTIFRVQNSVQTQAVSSAAKGRVTIRQSCSFLRFSLRLQVYSVHLFDKAFRVFADQTAVAHVLKYFAGKGIALRFQFFQIGRKLFVYGSLDPIPDMHIGIFENTVIGLFTLLQNFAL